MRIGRGKPGSMRISESSVSESWSSSRSAGVGGVGVAEAVEDLAQDRDRVLDAPHLAGGDEVRHQHERDRLPGEHHVVLSQPARHLGLEVGTGVAELGELDEVLELEVVDVVDQCGFDLIAAPPWPRRLRPRGRSRAGRRDRLMPWLKPRIRSTALLAPLVGGLPGGGAAAHQDVVDEQEAAGSQQADRLVEVGLVAGLGAVDEGEVEAADPRARASPAVASCSRRSGSKPPRCRYSRAAAWRSGSTSKLVTCAPPRERWSVDTPIAVPTSTARFAPVAAASTSSRPPVTWCTIGMWSRSPCSRISGAGAGRAPARERTR